MDAFLEFFILIQMSELFKYRHESILWAAAILVLSMVKGFLNFVNSFLYCYFDGWFSLIFLMYFVFRVARPFIR